jgi:hypothetical protein
VRAVVGSYEVTLHTWNLTACEPGGETLDDFSYFELREGDPFLGVASVELYECQDPTVCSDASTLYFFRDGSTWGFERTFASGTADACSLGKSRAELSPSDAGVRVEIREWGGSVLLDAAEDCLEQDANDYLDTLQCDLEVLEGAKL